MQELGQELGKELRQELGQELGKEIGLDLLEDLELEVLNLCKKLHLLQFHKCLFDSGIMKNYSLESQPATDKSTLSPKDEINDFD